MRKSKNNLECCPIHRILPVMLMPVAEEPNDEILNIIGLQSCQFNQYTLEVKLRNTFPATFLFLHQYTVFCPECAKENPTPGKYNKFGHGFCSQYSINAAKSNWNKAVKRYAKHMILDVLNGKK